VALADEDLAALVDDQIVRLIERRGIFRLPGRFPPGFPIVISSLPSG
jgi:hypothetical protein